MTTTEILQYLVAEQEALNEFAKRYPQHQLYWEAKQEVFTAIIDKIVHSEYLKTKKSQPANY